jgi:hypothetical protein
VWLAASAGYRALSSAKKEMIRRDMVTVIMALAAKGAVPRGRSFDIGELRDALHAADGSGVTSIDAVNFPGFIDGLIRGVFDAIVDASIQQMDAYVDHLHELAASVDRFIMEEAENGSTGGDAKRRHDP